MNGQLVFSPEGFNVNPACAAILRSVAPKRPVLAIDICGEQLTWALAEVRHGGIICLITQGGGTLHGCNAAQRSLVLEL